MQVPGEAKASSSSGSITIAPGDTLAKLAQEHGTTVESLAAANGISDVNFIVAGDTLSLG